MLETRLQSWLDSAKWDRAVCGRWIFTWNAFRIDCDPQSVLKLIGRFDFGSPELRNGAAYQDSEALSPGILSRSATNGSGATFVVLMKADPVAVRRARGEADVATGEIMRKPVSLQDALRERAKEEIVGTISVAFDADTAGQVRKRTKVIKLKIKRTDGVLERRETTESIERRLISTSSSRS